MVLSIIIPVYNVEKFLEKCVDSTQSQNIEKDDYEVILINDGSTDNSLEIAKRLEKKYTNIKVVSKENGGLSSARNYGIEQSKGAYIMFLDSDDWIADNCLYNIRKKLIAEHPDCLGICAANVIGNNFERRFSYKDESPKKGRDLFCRNFSPCAPFSIWRKSFIDKFKLRFKEGIYHEDLEFTPRAYYYAEKMSFTNDIIYYVFQNPNSITRTINPKKSFDLIEHVSESLYAFIKCVDYNYQIFFFDIIGIALNAAMDGIRQCSKDDQKEFGKLLSRKKHLIECLAKSSIKKYRFEYNVLSVFSKNPLLAYILMQKVIGH